LAKTEATFQLTPQINESYKSFGIEQQNFAYIGAFRFPVKPFGTSRMAYAQGPFTIDSASNSVYIVGHAKQQAIAELNIPSIKNAPLKDLSIAKPIQPFYTFLKGHPKLKNKQKLDRITGMEIIEGSLFVNAMEFYDANNDVRDSTFIIDKHTDLAKSNVRGFFQLQGRAHSSGWISKIPTPWQTKLDSSYLIGNASNFAINSRLSIGPTFFGSYLEMFAGIDEKNGLIPASALMDFSLKNPLHQSRYNKSKNNNVWTEVSNAVYGFIPPKSNTYVVIGNSGGHHSSIGYKIKPKNGPQCGGPCPKDAHDSYNYIWLFNMNDILATKSNPVLASSIRPYRYGVLKVPFQPGKGVRKIIGADFDEYTNRLYLLVEAVDRLQSKWEATPVMLVYQLSEPLPTL
jgi:hypothetical protein